MTLHVLFTPAEFEALNAANLSNTTCVVFDVLRATTSMMSALANGASGIVAVGSIGEALQARSRFPGALLAGERGGLRITAEQSGGVEFTFGNSPREFTPERVRGATIISTTSNGTRALRACAPAHSVYAAAFANLSATAAALRKNDPEKLLLVCSGTGELAALEDTLCAGALADQLWEEADSRADSAAIARALYRTWSQDLFAAMEYASNARRLLAIPELAEDVAFCLRRDTADFVAKLGPDGVIRREQP